jgi:hypothetical protein
LTNVSRFEVGANTTLLLSIDQFQSGAQITTAPTSTVAVTLNNRTLSRSLDISDLALDPAYSTINLDLAGHSLTLNADQADGVTLINSAGGQSSVRIVRPSTGFASGSYNLDNIDLADPIHVTVVVTDLDGNGEFALDVSNNVDVQSYVDAYEIGAGATLTIQSAQVSSKTVTGLSGGGNGAIVVKLGTDNFNLSGIDADPTGVNGVVTSAVVAANVTLHASADLGTFVATTVNTGAALTLTANQATTQTITAVGTGTIAVTAASAATVYNFADLAGADRSKVVVTYATGGTLSTDTVWGDAAGDLTVSIASGQTLTALTSQVDGEYIQGSGNLTVTGFDTVSADATDLSHISAATKMQLSDGVSFTGSFNSSATVTVDTSVNTELRALDITGATGRPNAFVVDDDVTLTMTATQAHQSAQRLKLHRHF